jgi:toxin FitB
VSLVVVDTDLALALLRRRTPDSLAIGWGEIQASAQLRGRPRPASDRWIAACYLVRNRPLATFNIKDYADFAEHEGLQIVL